MEAGCRYLSLFVLVLFVAGCGASSGTRIERDSADMYELVATFHGKAAPMLGTSHEWWSPRSDLFRVERKAPETSFELVNDGSAMTRRTKGRLYRVEGERAMMRFTAGHLSIFDVPAIVALRQHFNGGNTDALKIKEKDGGRAFDVDLNFGTDTGTIRIRYTVEVRDRISIAEARDRGLLRQLSGPVAGEFRQSPPGTPPHFGQRAYWFGPTFGEAKAVTALEQRGGEPFRGEPEEGAKYTTMYRLPPSAAPAAINVNTSGTYPGLGAELAIDIRVECNPKRAKFVAQSQKAPGLKVTLANGERGTLYIEPYSQGDREGVFADVFVGGTVCFVRGLVSPGEFKRLLPTLRPL